MHACRVLSMRPIRYPLPYRSLHTRVASMASEMYSLISNQAKTDDFTSSFNVQSGALSQVRPENCL